MEQYANRASGASPRRVGALCLLGQLLALTLVVQGAKRMQEPKEEIADLLTILKKKESRQADPERLAKAIHQAGDLRVEAAIPDLVGLLDFKRTFSWESQDAVHEIQPITRSSRYPAIAALGQIGPPALPSLVRAIEDNNPDSLLSLNSLESIRVIFREKPRAGVAFLKKAVDAASSAVAKKRLSLAVAELEALTETPGGDH